MVTWQERARRPRTIMVAVVLVATAVAGVVVWQGRPLPDTVAYSIDGDRTTAAELQDQAITLEALYGVAEPDDEQEAEDYWRDVAQSAVVSDLLDQAAADEGIVVADKEVDDALARYVSALYDGAPDAQTQFVSALGTAGTSQRAVETEIARRMTTERLLQSVVGDLAAPTAEEAAAEFTSRGCSLDLPETRTLRNIVVATEAEATAVASDLAAGSDFATLASQRSADPSSRDSGGEIGTLAARQLEEGYAQVAFAAPAGAVFGPVETTSGWNVGQVVAVVPARTVDFAEIEASFTELLLLEAQSKAWRAWLTDLIAAADVEYSDRFRPDDPMALPGGVATWAEQNGVCPAGAEGAS